MTFEEIDPVLLEVIRHELLSVSEGMNITMRRTTRSIAAKETNDFSSAILDASGTPVMLATPYGLRVFAQGVTHLIAKFKDRFQSGDVIISNDPYRGTSHLSDILVVTPIIWHDQLVGFTSSYQHHTDIGGRFPGGFGTESRQLFEEGLCLPVVHLYRCGERNQAVFDIIAANVRAPDDVLGDLEANAAACRRGATEMVAIFEKYGPDLVSACCEHFIRTTQNLVRQLVSSIPDGLYRATGLVDDGVATRFNLKLLLVIEGDQMTVDLSGSSPQNPTAWNMPPGMAMDAVFGSLIGLLPSPNMVVNAGLINEIELIAEPGTVVNPHFPGAVASRAQPLFVLTDLMLEALAEALPGQIPAPGEGGMTAFVFSPEARHGKAPGVLTDIWCGGWGARPLSDGVEGVVTMSSNGFRTSSAELMELGSPVEIDGFGFVPDTGGPGEFRGNMSMYRRFRVKESGRVMLRTGRSNTIAPGRDGGSPGGPYSARLIRDGHETLLPRHGVLDLTVESGDLIEHIVSGGSGYGEPFDRDPQRVLEDVLDEKVSLVGASDNYGVVIDPRSRMVDIAKTQALRNRSGIA